MSSGPEQAHDHQGEPAHEHEAGFGHGALRAGDGRIAASSGHDYVAAGEHPHEHADHDHEHGASLLQRLRHLLPGHSHAATNVDTALESSARGIRALQISLLILGATAAIQVVVTLLSGSAALLTDTLHNFSDALTALPLWVAFSLGRRPSSRRFTYGFGRAEDLAGIVILGFILFSAVVASYESMHKLLNPHPVHHIGWVIAAGIIGFAGNEFVAIYRTNVGRQIGSAALVADGQHAKIDGLTSLAVVAGALGVMAGLHEADGVAGLLITLVILVVLKDTAVMMWFRLMDAVDPELVARIEKEADVDGVERVGEVRVRWVGHRLFSDIHILVDEDMSTRESHAVAEAVRHSLYHAEPQLASIHVHVDPCGHSGGDAHTLNQHHAG